jgi:hypothetical protein
MSGRQSLDIPYFAIPRLSAVQKAVMQAVFPALPELDLDRFHPVSPPE